MMDHNCIIVRYAEIALKGRNRIIFEKLLVKNIKSCLKINLVPYDSVERIRGKIVINTHNQCSNLKNVFGISSISYALRSRSDVNDIFHTVEKLFKNFENKSFRVTVKRADKSFPMNSMELERMLGEFILNNTKSSVKLKDFDVELKIEISDKHIYISIEKISGAEGLPLGSGGFSLALIEDEHSLVASWLMMKRGIMVFPVSKEDKDISLLKKFSYGYKLKLKIIKPESFERYADENNIYSIIVNDRIPDLREDYNLLTLRPIASLPDDHILTLFEMIKNS